MIFKAKTTALALAVVASLGLVSCESMTGIGLSGGEADYSAMVDRFTELHTNDPGDVKAAVGLSKYLRYSGRADEAYKVLKADYVKFSDEPLFMTEMGVVELMLGNVSEAQEALERSNQLNGEYWRTHASLGIVYDLGEAHDQAVSSYYKALEYCPDSSAIQNNLGLSAGYVGDIQTAINHLEKARALQPSSQIIRNNLAMFENIQLNCPECSPEEYSNLTRNLYTLDWPAGEGGMSCADVDANARAIVDEIKEKEFIDLYIHFAFDSAVLAPKSEGALDQLALAMMSNDLRDASFMIEGHTDAAGSDDYNMGLSDRRAASVVNYLVASGGIDRARLESMGFGESRLLDPKHPLSGVNRRVRITLVK
ncbi:MAG: hypothetical protein EP340_10730 [Alphaproteobacteria bacterium]|nr:MAG: hypothetical protein EP340_10730 [Alphaproteobacteria bacterium]